MAKVRQPCQAGAFYEGNSRSLQEQIEGCFLNRLGPGELPESVKSPLKRTIGLVCPHAGYMFSGPVAAHSYFQLAADGRPDTVFLFGPNHTGIGSGLAVMAEGSWRTPLGDVEIDSGIAEQFVSEAKIVDVDESAHTFEHSIEVQLPFLQYLYGSDFKIVPVCFQMQDISSATEVGRAAAKIVGKMNAVIIASSDMTHYEPQQMAEKKDRKALEAVEALDEARFYSVIEADRVTACGYGAIAALIVAAKTNGAKEAKLLCYKTSGDIIGDYSSVVGYAALCLTK